MTLAKWKSHKVVRAGKIIKIPAFMDGTEPVVVEGLHGPVPITPQEGLFNRGHPNVGDYLVIYESTESDPQWMSWSPALAFERGYGRFESE